MSNTESATTDGLEVVAALEKVMEYVLHPAAEENALAQAMHERDARRYFADAANPVAISTVLTLLAASRAEVERLRAVGGLLANTMFNLGQHDGHVLTKDECRLFRVMQRDWDAAISTNPTKG